MKTGIIEELRKIATASISDSLDRVGIVRGIAAGVFPLLPNFKIVGPAVTLRQVPSHKAVSSPLHEEVVETIAKRGDVVVIEVAGGIVNGGATWGASNSMYAKIKGIEGVVLDGATRDVERIRELRFPVFARTRAPGTSRGRYETVSINQPVLLSGARVRAGDIVVGDDDGVVVIPIEEVERALELAKVKERFDGTVTNLLQENVPILEAFERAKKENGW
ncbi:MAG: RraA family protein [Candidatus Bathyarchaeia archaeon]|jgi:4-hydroxy-4-methyl-2-oxoglutarate aldolase